MFDGATAPYETMGPATLAETPAVEPHQDSKPPKWWPILYLHVEATLGALRNWRWSWWAHWARVAEYYLPRRYHWFITANRMARGSPINDQIIDSTGGQALITCASGMWSGMTNPARPWKKLGSALPWVEPDADGKKWLEAVDQKVDTVLAQSNFYTEMAQAFQDVTAFGQAPVIVYEDAEDVARFYLPCAGEYFLGSGARLSIDKFYREFTFTVSQIVEFAGLANCPQSVTAQWAQGRGAHENEFVVCHAIEPNFALGDANATAQVSPLPGVFTWREVYWIKGEEGQKPLSLRGFHVKPFFVLGWAKVSNDPYCRSPCMENLGDQKQIQLQTLRLNEYIEKGVRPPMGATPDLKNEPASINPAQITYMNTEPGKKGFWPLFEVLPTWVQALVQTIEKCAERIKTGLFVDVFMAITNMQGVQPRNELELSKRDLERLQKLGPVIQRTEEGLSECIHRLLNILERRRLIPPPPPSMRGVPLKVEYISIMRLAQEQAKAVGMKDFLGSLGALSSAAHASGVPDPIRKFDLQGMAVGLSELAGVSSKYVFSDEQVKAHDAARAQAAQAGQAPSQAMAAVTAAKTLSQTELPHGGNALGALLGGGGLPQ